MISATCGGCTTVTEPAYACELILQLPGVGRHFEYDLILPREGLFHPTLEVRQFDTPRGHANLQVIIHAQRDQVVLVGLPIQCNVFQNQS